MSPRQRFSDLRNYLRVALSDRELAKSTLRKLRIRGQRKRVQSDKSPEDIEIEETLKMTAREAIRQVSQSFPVVVLSDTKRTTKVGVADRDFAAAVTFIQRLLPQARIYLDQDRFDDDPRKLGRAVQRSERVSFAFQGRKGRSNLIEIEMYEQRGDSLWVSRNTSNTSGRALYDDPFQNPGTIGSATVFGGQTIEEKMDSMPVDVVISWVNHEDTGWQEKFKQHVQNVDTLTDATALTRFSDSGELRFCLRSVAKYLPWVRHIYVVSNCTPPEWMNIDHKRITWVDHSEIVDPEFLPVFNSHAIETYLHHIPALSEHFLYFNDDVFVCRPQPKRRFFNANETSCSFMQPYGMVTGDVVDGAPDYLNASRNSAALLNEALGYIPTQLHEHVPFALRRSVLNIIEDTFETAIESTRRAKFRSKTDINLTSFLYHHFAFWQTKATFENVDAVMLRNTDLRWKAELDRVTQNGCDFLCVNEGGTSQPSATWRSGTALFLNRKFPNFAPWERD